MVGRGAHALTYVVVVVVVVVVLLLLTAAPTVGQPPLSPALSASPEPMLRSVFLNSYNSMCTYVYIYIYIHTYIHTLIITIIIAII